MSAPEIQLDDDVFDANFLEELDKLEVFATASSTQNHRQPPQPPPPPPFQSSFSTTTAQPQRQQFQPPSATATVDWNSYSPPRQLSQRIPNTNNNNNSSSIVTNSNSSTITHSFRSPITAPNPGIDFLKGELSRVSKQLSDLKDECAVLRKERDKREQLKFSHSNVKTGSCDAEAPLVVHPGIGASRRCENLNSLAGGGHIQAKTEQKSVGIQTDRGDEYASPSISGAASSFLGVPKLLEIWSSRSCCCFPRSFVAKLVETCATDFCALFGSLGLNMTSKTVKKCVTHVRLPANVVDPRSTEFQRVSELYSVLNKLSVDLVHINAFVDVLLDLCELENALVVHRSLRILHVAVGYILSSERTCSRSVLCSGIMSKGSDVTLDQILKWRVVASCVTLIKTKHPFFGSHQLVKI